MPRTTPLQPFLVQNQPADCSGMQGKKSLYLVLRQLAFITHLFRTVLPRDFPWSQAFGVLLNTPDSVTKKLEPLDEVMLEPREPANELERQTCEGLRVLV